MASEEEYKLMYGMLFSMKSFCNRLSPTDQKDGFLGYKTSKYKLHFYETPTGIKIVMTTDPNIASMRDILQQIYSQFYLEYVVRNPLYQSGNKIVSELFKSKLDEFVRSLPVYGGKS